MKHNEYTISILDKEYKVKLPFEFFKVESELGQSLAELAIKSEKAQLQLHEIYTVLKYALDTNEIEYDDDELKEQLVEQGLFPSIYMIQELLLAATYGGKAREMLDKLSADEEEPEPAKATRKKK